MNEETKLFDLDKPLHLLPLTAPLMNQRLPEFDFENPTEDPLKIKDALLLKLQQLDAAGLSANQVGLPYRVFVYGTRLNPVVCFNPKIMGVSAETVLFKEGCVSLPGVWLMLSRPASVMVAYQTETGEIKALELVGIEARVFQHEMDHME